MESFDVSVIIPAYNEEKTIFKIIEKTNEVFNKINKKIEIIVINDASTDNTKQMAEKAALIYKNIVIINNEKNQGKTKNILNNLKITRAHILAFIDADYQYDPIDLPNVINKIDEGYDICGGIRTKRKDSLYRIFMSKSFNLFNLLMFRIKLKDVNCGLKAFRKDIMDIIKPEYLNAKWFIDTELLARAYENNLKITEVSINHYPRLEGESKVSGIKLATETAYYGVLLKFKLLKKRFFKL